MRKIISLILLILVGIGVYYIWLNFFADDSIKLYFATKDGMGLQVEKRKVKGDKKWEAVRELIAGPTKPGLFPTIPPEVELLNIRVKNGLCVVNFNEKLITNHWGGSTGEILTVYSIVNTLCQFPDVERVQILVEGRKVQTLAGHLNLEESFEANEELVK
ncbi:hypothetical protein BBF96_08420 [Anoxybacter fermentans]|uniref:GerMN domain-containing protein n=1 Tax=Anoxybacter fermentans TaxID=1323375 RepID=A0A3S9SYQ7_9FIRM|nr:GerMN domain-containing protein [Anoxybacter fermentans]AZR73404.1 hypothetical protein BBF96_08420 [Anoxybacter fermentans]